MSRLLSASTIRRSLMANKLRSLLLGAILLFVIAPALVGLLIYSFGGFPHPQQKARQVDPRCWGSFAWMRTHPCHSANEPSGLSTPSPI